MRNIKSFLNFFQYRAAGAISSKVSSKTFEKIINQKYINLKSANQSKYLSILIQDIPRVSEALGNFVNLVSNFILLTFISISLIYIENRLFLISIFVLSIIYSCIIFLFAKNLKENGENITKYNLFESSLSRSTLASIVNIIVGNSIYTHIKNYRKNENRLRRSQANSIIYSQIPRYIVETIGLVLFTLFIIVSLASKSSFAIIAQLGTLFFAFNRILPACQISYAAYANIRATTASTKNVLYALNLENKKIIKTNKRNYKKDLYKSNLINKISINNLCFKYIDKVIEYEDFIFEQGKPTVIVGKSGSGKTTLIEMLLGLMEPLSGKIKLNDIELSKIDLDYYYQNITYLSQSPFLFSGTLIDNIFFGNQTKLKKEELYKNGVLLGLEEEFGENFLNYKISDYGRNISGGQAQRISLLRILSNIKPLIIMDEPTSALDAKTAKIFNELLFSKTKDSILIVISHSQSQNISFPAKLYLKNS